MTQATGVHATTHVPQRIVAERTKPRQRARDGEPIPARFLTPRPRVQSVAFAWPLDDGRLQLALGARAWPVPRARSAAGDEDDS